MRQFTQPLWQLTKGGGVTSVCSWRTRKTGLAASIILAITFSRNTIDDTRLAKTATRAGEANTVFRIRRGQGALANAGYQISDTTVGNILGANQNISRNAVESV